MASFTKDMTHGGVFGHLVRFTLPLLLSNLLQQTYNIADTLIVGKFLGDDKLAAVGATGSVTYFFYTLCFGLSIGAGVMVSQYFGAGQTKKVIDAICNSAWVALSAGAVLSVLSVLLTRPLLVMLQTPENLLDDAAEYMRIACAGTAAVALYNWITSVLRALGDAKTPLIFLAVSTVLNIILDLAFVVGFGFGVAGAAAATIISQGISAALSIAFAYIKNKELRPTAHELLPNGGVIKKCIGTGIPIALQNGFISASMIVIQSVTNTFGETVMAAYTVTMRIEQLVQQPFSSLNAAMSTFTGQNIGAGSRRRATDGLRAGIIMSTVFAAVVILLFAVFRTELVSLFVSGEKTIEIGAWGVLLNSSFYISLGVIHVTRGFLNGAGDTAYALFNGLVEVVCRVSLSITLTQIALISYRGIWITTCVTWLVTAVVGVVRVRQGKWKKKALLEDRR